MAQLSLNVTYFMILQHLAAMTAAMEIQKEALYENSIFTFII